VKFSMMMPGLIRFPPELFVDPAENWETAMGTDEFRRIAQLAERVGFDALTVSEHLVVPTELAHHMGGHFPDALTAMAFLAGATTRIRVCSSVLVLPYHPPIQLAKAVSTLDLVSGGRVTLNVGVGMARGEFEALGVPFTERGRITDEYVRAMKVLWCDEQPSFAGTYTSFDDVVFAPRPVQRPHPPLWFGGRSAAAASRALRLGDGWAPDGAQSGKGPWLTRVEDLRAFLAQVAEQIGCDVPEHFDIAAPLALTLFDEDHRLLAPSVDLSTPQAMVDRIGELEQLGVTWTAMPHITTRLGSIDEYVEHVERFATEVMQPFRARS
jgi:probable F420-dependent oxidoreductase